MPVRNEDFNSRAQDIVERFAATAVRRLGRAVAKFCPVIN
jgi:hypothetical protein